MTEYPSDGKPKISYPNTNCIFTSIQTSNNNNVIKFLRFSKFFSTTKKNINRLNNINLVKEILDLKDEKKFSAKKLIKHR